MLLHCSLNSLWSPRMAFVLNVCTEESRWVKFNSDNHNNNYNNRGNNKKSDAFITVLKSCYSFHKISVCIQKTQLQIYDINSLLHLAQLSILQSSFHLIPWCFIKQNIWKYSNYNIFFQGTFHHQNKFIFVLDFFSSNISIHGQK